MKQLKPDIGNPLGQLRGASLCERLFSLCGAMRLCLNSNIEKAGSCPKIGEYYVL
jgi:hypothetical protein